jgi:hypothetical protein
MDHAASDEVGVGVDFADGCDGCAGHAGGLDVVCELGAGAGTGAGGDLFFEGVDVGDAVFGAVKARVVGQVGPAEGGGEAAPVAFGDADDGQPAVAGG